MTTVNMKDFIENGSKVTQGVMEEINKSVKPIIERERTKEDRSADIGELTGKYAVWTCWNESTQSLNFGHYDLTKETAIDILFCKGEWDF